MSDDEYIYDEEDWLDFEDSPYNEAEDLATHTMPSPLFINYESDDNFSYLSDWEYDHDDYWDQDTPRKRNRNNAREDAVKINDGPKKKRRRLDGKKDIPGFSLEGYKTAAPTVIWKSKCDPLSSAAGPIVKAGQGEKVALLEDWRERFKSQPNHAASRPDSNPTKRKGSQIATAVVIGDGSPEFTHSTTLPPTTLEKATGLPSRSRVFPSIPEHKCPVVNGTIPNTSDSELIPGSSNSSRLVRNTAMAGKKRNLEELPNYQEDELPASKKRPGRPKKNTADKPQLSKQPLANRTNISTPASKKRKADDSEDRSIMSPPKRAQTAKTKGVEASASEGNGSSTRRTARRTR